MAIETIKPTYQEGSWVKVRLGALNGTEIFEEGVIVEVTAKPPANRSRIISDAPFWYRLNGRSTYCREDAIVSSNTLTHQRLIA